MDGADARRDARPDRPARRRFRPRLRLAERGRHGRRCAAGCRPSRRASIPSRRSSRWRQSATCCSTPASSSTTTAGRLTYPDIKCVYWAGGNPFHHHQNLPRLRRALGRVDTVVVHDPYWTAMAKHADVVVPSTTAFERDDYSGSRNDPLLMAMPALASPTPNRATTTRHSRRWPTGSASASSSPRAAPRGSGWGTCTTSGRPSCRFRRCRPSTSSGQRASLRLPTENRLVTAGRLPRRSRRAPARHPSGRIEIFSRRHRRVRLRRLRGPSDVVRARRVAGWRARRRLSAAPARQPARHAAAQPARRRPGQHGLESARARADPDAPTDARRAADRGEWCACSTTAAPAWRAWSSTTRCAPAWCSCRPARGTTRATLPTRRHVRARQPQRAHADVGTSSLAQGCTGAHVLVEVEKFDGRCHRCGHTSRRRSSSGAAPRSRGLRTGLSPTGAGPGTTRTAAAATGTATGAGRSATAGACRGTETAVPAA